MANTRATLGMFGSGYIEMLARQMTAELQAIRNSVPPGGSRRLSAKGIDFGLLVRAADGSWLTSQVEGLPAVSLATTGAAQPPNLVIRPFHQAGRVVSLREFTNNAFNHHHGIQSPERFGSGSDADGDGFVDELTRADVTAATIFQATMAVPGRVIPDDPEVEEAVLTGERRFAEIGCTSCHVISLPLNDEGWVFTEPNPFNPPGNLRAGDVASLQVDLSSHSLSAPRLRPRQGIVSVPACAAGRDVLRGPGCIANAGKRKGG